MLSCKFTQNIMIFAYVRVKGVLQRFRFDTEDAAFARCEFNKMRFEKHLPITSAVLMVEEIAVDQLKIDLHNAQF